MIRRVLVATVLTACTAAVAFGQQNATFVLSNGQRVSGALSYEGGNDFKLNGQAYPQSDVAIIAFVPGDPSTAELAQLAPGRNPSELQRNMIVMRDGSVSFGKLYSISADGRTVTINTTATDRRDIPSDNIARIYINGSAARRVYNFQRAPGGAAAAAVATTGAVPGAIAVNANTPWTDTGMTVKKGDRIAFQSTGQVSIAPGATANADGFSGDTGPRNTYPVPVMPAGGLIGRVGNSAAFPIGSNAQPITMPSDGRLYLGVNDSNFSDNSGTFSVTMIRQGR